MFQDQNSLEKKVWEMEASYWNSLKNKDIATYRSLLHPQFSDWPGFSEKPVLNPEAMIEIVKAIQNDIDQFEYELEPTGTSIINENQVIVYFNCKISINNNGEVNQKAHRMIHIWIRHKNEWLLLGGLQSP